MDGVARDPLCYYGGLLYTDNHSNDRSVHGACLACLTRKLHVRVRVQCFARVLECHETSLSDSAATHKSVLLGSFVKSYCIEVKLGLPYSKWIIMCRYARN
jgi:hypothetical protein